MKIYPENTNILNSVCVSVVWIQNNIEHCEQRGAKKVQFESNRLLLLLNLSDIARCILNRVNLQRQMTVIYCLTSFLQKYLRSEIYLSALNGVFPINKNWTKNDKIRKNKGKIRVHIGI